MHASLSWPPVPQPAEKPKQGTKRAAGGKAKEASDEEESSEEEEEEEVRWRLAGWRSGRLRWALGGTTSCAGQPAAPRLPLLLPNSPT